MARCFSSLERRPCNNPTWTSGNTGAVRLVVSPNGTKFYVDGVMQLSDPFTGFAGGVHAGLFNRNSANNLWDQFAVLPD